MEEIGKLIGDFEEECEAVGADCSHSGPWHREIRRKRRDTYFALTAAIAAREKLIEALASRLYTSSQVLSKAAERRPDMPELREVEQGNHQLLKEIEDAKV